MNILWKVDNFCSIVKSTLCTKKIQKRTYGDFDDDFFYKNWKKKIFWKSHTWGFQHFFKKKWKINIFYMCLEFIHMQIWTLFFTKIRKMKIYYTSWKFSHIGVLTIFSKKTEKWMLDTYVGVWRKHTKRNIWPMINMCFSAILTAKRYFWRMTLRKSLLLYLEI